MLGIMKNVKRFLNDENQSVIMNVSDTESFFTILSDDSEILVPRMRVDFTPVECIFSGAVVFSYVAFLDSITYFKDSPEPLMIELDYDMLHFDDGISPPDTILVGEFDMEELNKKTKWNTSEENKVTVQANEFFLSNKLASGLAKKTLFLGNFDTSRIYLLVDKDKVVVRASEIYELVESNLKATSTNGWFGTAKKLTLNKKTLTKIAKVIGVKTLGGETLDLILPEKSSEHFIIKRNNYWMEVPRTYLDENEPEHPVFTEQYTLPEKSSLNKKESLLTFTTAEMNDFLSQKVPEKISFDSSGWIQPTQETIVFPTKKIWNTLKKIFDENKGEEKTATLHISDEADGVIFVQIVTENKKVLYSCSSVGL